MDTDLEIILADGDASGDGREIYRHTLRDHLEKLLPLLLPLLRLLPANDLVPDVRREVAGVEELGLHLAGAVDEPAVVCCGLHWTVY